MKRVQRLAVLAACLAISACASHPVSRTTTPTVVQTVEPAAATDHVHEQPAPPLPPGVNGADVKFMQGMIGHHAQAIVMAALVAKRSASTNVQRLAQKIDISQRDEIGFMKRWLTERKQAVPDDAHAQHMSMPGMLTPEQMDRLEKARGAEFERLFLTFMIQHHEGALVMVDELFKSPGAAQESEIFRFASDVEADQRDEIFVMEQLIDLIKPTPSR